MICALSGESEEDERRVWGDWDPESGGQSKLVDKKKSCLSQEIGIKKSTDEWRDRRMEGGKEGEWVEGWRVGWRNDRGMEGEKCREALEPE